MVNHSHWSRLYSFNLGFNLEPKSTNSTVFPTCDTTLPFSGMADHNFRQMNPTSIQPPIASDVAVINSNTAASVLQKRLVVFDQSGDRTNMISGSTDNPFPGPKPSSINPVSGLPPTDETNASNPHRSDEMHEDTEEINALLDSDSENCPEEEEASTGHSPPCKTVTSEAAIIPVVPAKRRRPSHSDLDDTASSATVPNFHENPVSTHTDDDGGGGRLSKRVKRERIQETVRVLRRIVPRGRRKGEDAAAVLDEAIRYLRSLKLRARALGSAIL